MNMESKSHRGDNPSTLSLPRSVTPDQQHRDPQYQAITLNPCFGRKHRQLKVKQQRLLILIHSSICTRGSSCPLNPHCAKMKSLWEHMQTCRIKSCNVRHCYSSRVLLTQFRRCRYERCQLCMPVRRISVRMNICRPCSPCSVCKLDSKKM